MAASWAGPFSLESCAFAGENLVWGRAGSGEGRGQGLLTLGCCSLPSPQSAGETLRLFGQFVSGSENSNIVEKDLKHHLIFPFHREGCGGPQKGSIFLTAA